MTAQPFIPTTRDRPPTRPRQLADALLNLLYPESCFVCADAVARHQDCGVCGRCWDKLLQLRISAPWCPSCGLPFQGFDPGPAHLCSDCIADPPPFSGARSFGYYEGELSRVIREFKFHGRRKLASLLGPLVAAAVSATWEREQIDLLCPVPLHPKRRHERGFNQSELLARSMSESLGLPLVPGVLRRARHTPPQVGLTDPERLRNVRGAFLARPDLAAGRRVLLIDDVMTTGATLRNATSALLAGGALRVAAATLARAVPHT